MGDASILVVDDDRDVREILARALRAAGYDVCTAPDGRRALDAVARREIDLVIADLRMPELDGLSLVRELRAGHDARDPAIILMSGFDDRAARIGGFELGADDFVAKPIDTRELLAHVRAHLRRFRVAQRLRLESTTDHLTGILNRRGIVRAIARETARRTTVGTFVLMLDLDDFKGINDAYGHAAGDATLAAVAAALRDEVRVCDYVGRLGGDEFVVVLPDADEPAARALARRLRTPLAVRVDGAPLRVGLSVGVVALQPGESPEVALRRADVAMYRDKRARAGRRGHR